MDELKIVKLAELRSKIGGIPAKFLVAFLIAGGMYWKFSFEKFKENPVQNIFVFVVTYGIISYFWLCVKMTRNWIIGIVVAIVLIFVCVGSTERMGGVVGTLIAGAICFGGPVMDILAVVRYFIIKKKVFSTPEYTYESGSETYEEQWQQSAGRQEQQTVQEEQAQQTSAFFADCKDQAGVKRRYRDLCRVYHPDNGNGSPEVFNRITEEYEKLMAQYNPL